MSAEHIRTAEAATYVGIESTFGTTPSMVRAFPITDTFEPDLEQAEVDNLDESIYLWDVKNPVKGLKDGSAKLGFHIRSSGNRLTSGATPATPWLGNVLKACFGTELAAAGSTIQSSSTSTSIIVGTGHGSRFEAGQPILVDVGGVPEPTWVSSISTDTLTLGLALSASPTTGEDVINCYTYYPTASNTYSLALQHAMAGSSNHQWTLNGCSVDCQFKLERNKIPQLDVALKAATWTGPSDQSISTALGSNGMGDPFVVADGLVILQSNATSTRTHYPLRSMTVKLNHGMGHIEELAGGTQGKTGMMRMGQRVFAEIDLAMATDTALDSSLWTNRTDLQLFVSIPQGSGSTKTWMTFFLPKAIVVGKPKFKRDGGVATTTCKLVAKINTSGNINKPFYFAIG